MKYVVFYQRTWYDDKNIFSRECAEFRIFADEEEAAEFATRNDGVVLIPAKVNLKIEKPKNA